LLSNQRSPQQVHDMQSHEAVSYITICGWSTKQN